MRPTDVDHTAEVSGAERAGVALGVVVVIGAGAAATQTDSAAPIITLCGAVLVALITWYATNNRQKVAISAERARLTDELAAQRRHLEEQLAAERARLAEQLQHDRQVDDRRELRVRLDAVAGRYESARKAVRDAFAAVESDDQDAASAVELAIEDSLALFVTRRQLTLWLPDHHAAAVALAAAASALQDAAMDLEGGDVTNVEAQLNAASDFFDHFIEHGRPLVRPQLDVS